MDELVELFRTGQREFGARVHAIGDRWSLPTPNSEWTVARLVDHLIEEHRWVQPLFDGQDFETAGEIVEGTRDPGDREVAWEEAARLSYRSVSADGALSRSVALSYGPTPARDYVSDMTFDLAVHSWDLGTALKYDRPLPPELVDFALARAEAMGNERGMPGVFGPPVDVPDDAPAIVRLVALTGRRPN
jgi:uncharacterized protein (TIGR03086 family)